MYARQIKILEQRIEHLKSAKPFNQQAVMDMFEMQNEVRKLRRLEWEEIYETVKMEEDR